MSAIRKPLAPLLALLPALLLLATSVLAADHTYGIPRRILLEPEQILSFDVGILVRPDGTLEVTETITVRTGGDKIKHGIYRDFPLQRRLPDGRIGTVGFDVREVLRDGEPIFWYRWPIRPGWTRIYMGSWRTRLPPDIYTYTLRYDTTRQLRFFKDHDELYWNVTGDGWKFLIRRASVSVHLPPGARILRHALYTGRRGETGGNARVIKASNGYFEAATTRPLLRGEGFTIAIAFPKGVMAEPDRMRRFLWWLRDNAGPLWLLAGVLILLAWFLLTWRKHGRDPAPGAIIPRWEPPEGVSPAAAYWIWERAEGVGPSERRAFIVALISLATKGFIKLERVAGDIILVRRKPPGTDLPPGEALLMKELFALADDFIIGRASRARLSDILDEFADLLQKEVERAHVKSNFRHFAKGAILAAIIYAGLWVLHFLGYPSATNTLAMAHITTLPALIVGFLVITYFSDQSKLWQWLLPMVMLLPLILAHPSKMPILLVTPEGEGLPRGWKSAVFIASLSLPMILLSAWYLLPRPTRLGRKVLDEIAGLRQFIATAEKERLNRLPSPGGRAAPSMSVLLFEMLLPWAIAFKLEKPWTRAFQAWLDRAMPQATQGYAPVWYHGHSLSDIIGVGDSAGLTADLESGIANAMTTPSSSGFGGGGGVGGGGGGGGGGGF